MKSLNRSKQIKPLALTSSLLSTLILAACVQEQTVLTDNIEPVMRPSITQMAPLDDIAQNESEIRKERKDAVIPKSESLLAVVKEKRSQERLAVTSQLPGKSMEMDKMKRQQLSRIAVKSMPSSVAMGYATSADYSAPEWQTTVNTDEFAKINENPVKRVVEEPVSTFSIDVDTGAYSVVRAHINRGVLPPADAVRIEEMVNYFDYQYPKPENTEAPFSVSTEIAQTPWNANTQLVQVGLQGYLDTNEQRSAANLVFLMDVSGSMNAADKLPLLKNAFRLLVKKLTKKDKVTMVVYAGSSGVVLETTDGDNKGKILAALDKLSAGGSTHGSSGIKLAYDMAEQSFIKGGINRVILATDGDFNVGTVNHEALINLIEQKKHKGIALTTLGFGHGNYNDHLMEQLADHGDGNYAYIDNLNEARKTLVEQISSTLEIIAKDVKIQIEWNPSVVAEYRLVGYQNRLLNREDFNNDKIDAGEIGAGHTVTALYEITLAQNAIPRIDPLRYQSEPVATGKYQSKHNNELAFLKLRYKKPEETKSRLIEQTITQNSDKLEIEQASDNLRFAASVAAFGDLLRGGVNVDQFNYQDVLNLARKARGDDLHGYRSEFIRLVELSETLDSKS